MNKSGKGEDTKDGGGSFETVMDELYYSHLLELLFDHGSGSPELQQIQKTEKRNMKKNKIKKPINKFIKSKGAKK